MRSVPLIQLQIPHPCTQSWAGMSGSQERRYCDSCRKHVHNLVELPREEAAALIRQPHTCVRVMRTAEGRVLTADDFPLPRLRRALNRGGLRLLSRVILLVAPLIFASCRRFVQTTAGTPVPPPSCRTVMGDVALPPPPTTAPAPAVEQGELIAPSDPAPATLPETLGKPVPPS